MILLLILCPQLQTLYQRQGAASVNPETHEQERRTQRRAHNVAQCQEKDVPSLHCAKQWNRRASRAPTYLANELFSTVRNKKNKPTFC